MVLEFCLLILLLPLLSAKLIVHLPGSPPVNFKQYSGYYNVTKNYQLHYWFLESKRSPSEDPLFLWLTGGPGCSGLFSLVTTIGPFFVNPDGKTLKENPYSWNNEASVLILESPAGVGYSHAAREDLQYDDDEVAEQNYKALTEFFKEFPEYKNHDFYITGASYAGIYIPMLAHKVLQKQSDLKINLKGMIMSNGCVDVKATFNTVILYFYYHGLIEESIWERIKKECCNGMVDTCDFSRFNENPPPNENSDFCKVQLYNYEDRIYEELGLNMYNLHSQCKSQMSSDIAENVDSMQLATASAQVPCTNTSAMVNYFSKNEVREALFIPPHVQKWNACNFNITAQFNRRIDLDIHVKVREAALAGVKVLLFYGDMDMACNFLIGQKFVHQVGCKVTGQKQPIYYNGRLEGIRTIYGNVELDIIFGAGHMVPKEKPKIAHYLMDEFLKRPTSEVCVLNKSSSNLWASSLVLFLLIWLTL